MVNQYERGNQIWLTKITKRFFSLLAFLFLIWFEDLVDDDGDDDGGFSMFIINNIIMIIIVIKNVDHHFADDHRLVAGCVGMSKLE